MSTLVTCTACTATGVVGVSANKCTDCGGTGFVRVPTAEDLPGDAVNHPAHYKQVPGVECIEVARHFNFNRGNAIKYIWRAGAKGDEIEDLRKAIWYLTDEIARLEGRAQQ